MWSCYHVGRHYSSMDMDMVIIESRQYGYYNPCCAAQSTIILYWRRRRTLDYSAMHPVVRSSIRSLGHHSVQGKEEYVTTLFQFCNGTASIRLGCHAATQNDEDYRPEINSAWHSCNALRIEFDKPTLPGWHHNHRSIPTLHCCRTTIPLSFPTQYLYLNLPGCLSVCLVSRCSCWRLWPERKTRMKILKTLWSLLPHSGHIESGQSAVIMYVG